ncbi:tryptophan-rich sensory protein [Nodosilinea sp. FACHB-13]|uniref:tryptophan-rich sensory protein n=1 Tax=Cyanophyceae TaxID=3028117 RepID=UPI00168A2F1A|nr:tryptophan-rich sensory protein [Nodosilinea sp. FACHB-13]MBD2109054.1 tryptophan-rich sensory protein [Nodosilinea sp. FACHB-13]
MDAPSNRANSGTGLAIATAIAIAAAVVFNTLFNRFPPGGQNVGQIANTVLEGVLITPANYAFAIWGIIYLGLFAYAIYQFHPERRREPQLQQVNKLLIVACVVQTIWIVLFSLQQFGWSILAMLGILIPLIGIYLTLNIGLDGQRPALGHRVSRRRRWMAHIPFSLYLGWIAVATIVNVASALYASSWSGWGISSVTWTVAMIVLAAIVAEVVIYQRGDIAFTLVFVWALVAIAVRQSDIPAIRWMALIAAGVLVLWLTSVKQGWPKRSQE